MASEPLDIEFTDRYGGHIPSWLTACHDDCEATGHVPVEGPAGPMVSKSVVGSETIPPRYRAAWDEAHHVAMVVDPMHEATCDGWHFVLCPACHGHGTVSRWRALSRVPAWLVKGVRFIAMSLRNDQYRAPWTSRRAYIWLLIRCAYLYDLGWPNRP